jgi:hypothetical protein
VIASCRRTSRLKIATIYLFAGDVHHHRLAFAFAALRKPGGEALGEAFGSEPEAGFDSAVSDGQGVVKFRGVGEVAHAKLIEPFERAGAGFAADDNLYFESLCVHEAQEAGLKLRLDILR